MARRFEDIYAAAVENGDLEADPAQEGVLPEFTRIAEALERPASKRGWFSRRAAPEAATGLYLWGGVGRGKSMLMDLFFRNVDIEGKRRVHFHAFMQEVHKGINAAREQGVDDAIAPVADEISEGLRLLCFDEMQIGDITDAMIVGRLFERLFADGVTIVSTSNRVPDDLYKDGLNRQLFLPFIDLLKARMEVVELASPRDWRQDRIAGSDLYFHPADAEAREKIDRLWDRLADGPGEALELTVSGHSVTLPRYSGGVGRARFWDLCGKPLGAADYLAIAEHVRVLMLENIPRLGSDNYNEARRFVTLVDALYEARTRLIASAADVPENLYIEGTGSFEFERTASRLREMQSAEWGA